MKQKQIKRYYIVDEKTFNSFHDKKLTEISDILEDSKSYDSYEEAKQEFIKQLFASDKQSDNCTIIEIAKIVEYKPFYNNILLWLSIGLVVGVTVYYICKVV